MLTVVPALELLKLLPVPFLKPLFFFLSSEAIVFGRFIYPSVGNHGIRCIEYCAASIYCSVTEI